MTDNNQKSPAHPFNLDDSEPTAVLYAIQDLSHYTVEIHHQGNAAFIQKNGAPEVFLNIALAKQAALANNAVKGYMALSVTYQEVGDMRKGPLYEYMPTDLHSFN